MRIFLLLSCLTLSLDATVVDTKIRGMFESFWTRVEQADSQGLIDIKQFDSWDDIEQLPTEMQAEMLGSYSPNYPNVSDYYSIIPIEDRAKFPKGKLIAISSQPFNLTQFHRDFITRQDYRSEAELADFEANHQTDEIVRWYLAEDTNGEYQSEKISEEDLQVILRNTKLLIPKAEPYRFNIEQLMASSKGTKDAAALIREIDKPNEEPKNEINELTVEITKEAPKESTSWLLWLIGALVLLGGLALVVRRKN